MVLEMADFGICENPDCQLSYRSLSIEYEGWLPRGSSWGGYACAATVAGRVKWKVAPPPEAPVAHKRPPCDSMIEPLVGGPIPVPLSFVAKNALKICFPCSRGHPTPVSLSQ